MARDCGPQALVLATLPLMAVGLGFGLTRTIAEYEKIKVVGRGTYGWVLLRCLALFCVVEDCNG